MKKNKIVIITVLIVLATAFIFSNSLKNSEESNAASGVILELVKPILELITDSEAQASFIVRKGAHLTEFFLLGFLVLSAVTEIKKKLPEIVGFGFFYVLSVAVTDEFIQSFSDRTSSVRDVLIDFTGAMLGFAAYAFINYCVIKVNKRKSDVRKK